MTAKDKLLGAVSLSRRAGKLVMGFDAVKESVMKGQAFVVFCAADLSEGTRARVDRFCEQFGRKALTAPCTQEELLQVCPKRTGVFAVIDRGLAGLVKSSLSAGQNQSDDMEENA